jgi:predicted nucleic acid-binding protein
MPGGSRRAGTRPRWEASPAPADCLVRAEGTIIKPPREIPPIRIKDADDIPILACAIAGKADVFVTGDKELLSLRKAEGLVVVSPRELWLQLLGPESSPSR